MTGPPWVRRAQPLLALLPEVVAAEVADRSLTLHQQPPVRSSRVISKERWFGVIQTITVVLTGLIQITIIGLIQAKSQAIMLLSRTSRVSSRNLVALVRSEFLGVLISMVLALTLRACCLRLSRQRLSLPSQHLLKPSANPVKGWPSPPNELGRCWLLVRNQAQPI